MISIENLEGGGGGGGVSHKSTYRFKQSVNSCKSPPLRLDRIPKIRLNN